MTPKITILTRTPTADIYVDSDSTPTQILETTKCGDILDLFYFLLNWLLIINIDLRTNQQKLDENCIIKYSFIIKFVLCLFNKIMFQLYKFNQIWLKRYKFGENVPKECEYFSE